MTVYYVLNQLGPHSKGDVLSFSPEQIGAGVDISHLTTIGAIRVATPLLDPPSAPTLATAGSGGTVLAGVYTVKISYVTAVGETTPSPSATITTSGTTSTLTVTSPAPSTGATGWYASVSQRNGSSLTRQQTAPTPIGTNLVLTAPPTSTGPAPLGTNTSGEAARAVPAQIQATHAPQGVGVFTNNGVPDGTSYAGIAAYGSLCWNVAVSPPAIYVNTGTIAAPTWTASGGSSLPGVTSDGLTPLGLIIDGRLVEGASSGTTAPGILAHAEGDGTSATGEDCHAEGEGSIASGDYSHAEGEFTVASAEAAHSEGENTTASGFYSHSEGFHTTASGDSSHAEGSNSLASSGAAHAEGQSTASARVSHAEGHGTIASAVYSHSEGSITVSAGYASHAQGQHTEANGSSSHAEGFNGVAALTCESAHGFSDFGDHHGTSQYSRLGVKVVTTDATLTTLLTPDGTNADDSLTIDPGPVTLPANTTWQVIAQVGASQFDTPGTVAGWTLRALVTVVGGTARQIGSTDLLAFKDAAASTWDVALNAHGTQLDINVTGEAAKTIRWVAALHVVQVGI